MTSRFVRFTKTAEKRSAFAWGEFKGHKFLDMRIFVTEPGENGGKPQDPTPTKKGLAVSPALWLQFKEALTQVEAAMIQKCWLDRADPAGT